MREDTGVLERELRAAVERIVVDDAIAGDADLTGLTVDEYDGEAIVTLEVTLEHARNAADRFRVS